MLTDRLLGIDTYKHLLTQLCHDLHSLSIVFT